MSLSDFVFLSKIGEGSFSSVHKVNRISDSKIYALKQVKITTLKEKQKQNALNQVRILASISCPYIIGYKQAFFQTKTNTLCIVMQFADGGDLQKIIQKKKKSLSFVPESEIWKMAREVLSGLLVLHQMNIIHRDLKSANIFVSDGVYKLGDLNVSKLLKESLAYTQTGTPYYASPEVWNDKPYQLKSDIWSLGCIIYQYCCLKPPFTANSMEGLFKKVMRGIYPKIPSSQYSDKIQRFVAKCLQLDPKNRPNCKQLLDLIPKIEESSTIGSVKQKSSSQTNISLLNTIKVPRNLMLLINQLPKSNYQNPDSRRLTEEKPRFGNLSQKKLKQIVRQKNADMSLNESKKNSIRKITPQLLYNQLLPNYHSGGRSNIQSRQNTNQNPSNNLSHQQIQIPTYETSNQANHANQAKLEQQITNLLPPLSNKRSDKVQILPRIKIYSEPNDIVRSQVKRSVGVAGSGIGGGSGGNGYGGNGNHYRENYQRPVWWG